MYYLYLLECEDGTIYTGITNDVARRLKDHIEKRGGKYTRSRGAKRIMYTEEFPTKGEALRRELKVKRLKHDQKISLAATSTIWT